MSLKNLVDLRGEEVFNLVLKVDKIGMCQTVYSLVCVDLMFVFFSVCLKLS